MSYPDGDRGSRLHAMVRSQRSLDSSILSYLRKMISYSRRMNHRDARHDYERAWEFAAAKIYGPLPPRPVYNLRGNNPTELLAGEQGPLDVVSHLAPGAIRPAKPWPLRSIVKKFALNWHGAEYSYETLECQHVLMAPPGYSVPAKSRRCIYCAAAAAEKAAAHKKPAGRVRDERTKGMMA